ncbi:MAG: hypothetical protein KC731_12545 [Myxococcales bacterium]|nr:hypothetical protein [Myxococcales bacterium]
MAPTFTQGSQAIAAAFGTAVGASGLVVLLLGLVRLVVPRLRREGHARLSLAVGAVMTALGVAIFATSLM